MHKESGKPTLAGQVKSNPNARGILHTPPGGSCGSPLSPLSRSPAGELLEDRGVTKARAKATFPRPKAAELQEGLNHLTYFKELQAAQESAIKRLDSNRQICAKNVKLWTTRIEKLQETM